MTVPSARVDGLLRALRWLRWVDGLSLEEHHGYDPRDTVLLACSVGFELERHERFELGLNHLFVFRRSARLLRSL